ncbi:hypothetical protein CF327_g6281 [Tilletia walkeri]|nr:hypothetical protein CF327_g6281 [Tilletia walkeri]
MRTCAPNPPRPQHGGPKPELGRRGDQRELKRLVWSGGDDSWLGAGGGGGGSWRGAGGGNHRSGGIGGGCGWRGMLIVQSEQLMTCSSGCTIKVSSSAPAPATTSIASAESTTRTTSPRARSPALSASSKRSYSSASHNAHVRNADDKGEEILTAKDLVQARGFQLR